ncbi:MAG: cupin domain-containing protein [Planctomycetota bacterium]|jgi:mannose-6-phosphate isomerase-like protein (cupin superfamily)
MHTINLHEKLALVPEPWVPKVVAALNGQLVKLATFEGEYVWHAHAAEDELFLVVAGEIEVHFRDRVETVREGEMIVVPRGVEHKPVAASRASVLLFEPASTRNTGDVDHDLTIEADDLERI